MPGCGMLGCFACARWTRMSAACALQHNIRLRNAADNFIVQCNGKAFLKELVTLAGVEPATCGLGNRRSIHLSYRATLSILTRNISLRCRAESALTSPSDGSCHRLPSRG